MKEWKCRSCKHEYYYNDDFECRGELICLKGHWSGGYTDLEYEQTHEDPWFDCEDYEEEQ